MSSPYLGKRVSLSLDTGQVLVIDVMGVTNVTLVDVDPTQAVNAVALYDGCGVKIAGAEVGVWGNLFSKSWAATFAQGKE